ncbi:MAG: nucleotide-binding protein [Methanomicrobiales archaeon]|nr:nucleotide-binding protein [Methanomicrobiales archaeon]
MKFRGIELRVSPVNAGVALFFGLFLLWAYLESRSSVVLAFGIPMLILLFLIPIFLNYMSREQYADLLPQYQRDAQTVRIKAINLNMLGKPVRFEGVVEQVYFWYLNRPSFLVGDKSGEISVKMFTSPEEDIHKGDIVEVIGMVMKRYIITGDPVINCVSIRKTKTAKKAKND